jgi:tetratricopeptide (TPR) repeat protein
MASQAHHKMFHQPQATEAARRAWARFPGHPRVREQLASLLVRSQNRAAAARLCQEWLREEPATLPPLWMLGRIALAERRQEEGIGYYERALARQPDNVTSIETLANALLETPADTALPRAVELFSRAAAQAPESAQTRFQLGVALMRLRRLAEAQRQILRSLDLDPNRGEAYNVVVQLARRLRQPGAVALFGPMVRDVEERLREELRLWRHTWDEPKDAAGYLELARFLIRGGDLRRAESQLEEALVLRPVWQEAERERVRVRRLLAIGIDGD